MQANVWELLHCAPSGSLAPLKSWPLSLLSGSLFPLLVNLGEPCDLFWPIAGSWSAAVPIPESRSQEGLKLPFSALLECSMMQGSWSGWLRPRGGELKCPSQERYRHPKYMHETTLELLVKLRGLPVKNTILLKGVQRKLNPQPSVDTLQLRLLNAVSTIEHTDWKYSHMSEPRWNRQRNHTADPQNHER